MTSLREIEAAIDRLSREQAYALQRWLAKRLDAEWDAQIEQDVDAGRLNDAARKAIAEHRNGESRDFPPDGE